MRIRYLLLAAGGWLDGLETFDDLWNPVCVDISEGQAQILFQPRAKGFSGQADQVVLFGQPSGRLSTGEFFPGVPDPGKERSAGGKFKLKAGGQELFLKAVVARLHHPAVVRDPGVQIAAAVLEGQLGRPGLAHHHAVLQFQGLFDDRCSGKQRPAAQTGQGKGFYRMRPGE